MEDYTYEYGDYGTHTIQLTFQTGNYKGTVSYEVGGNVTGLGVLGIDIDDLAWVNEFKENTCEFQVGEDGWFSFILTDDRGKQLLIMEEFEYLDHYIVGLSIVGYKKEG